MECKNAELKTDRATRAKRGKASWTNVHLQSRNWIVFHWFLNDFSTHFRSSKYSGVLWSSFKNKRGHKAEKEIKFFFVLYRTIRQLAFYFGGGLCIPFIFQRICFYFTKKETLLRGNA